MNFRKTLLIAAALALACVSPAGAETWRPIGSIVSLSASATSSNVQLGWVGIATRAPSVAIVCNSGTTDAFVALGGSDLVISTRTPPEYGAVPGLPVYAGGCTSLPTGAATNIAAITASGTTSLNVQTGVGTPIGLSTGVGTVFIPPTSCAGLPNGAAYYNGSVVTICAAAALTWGGLSLTWGGVAITGL